MSEIPQGMIHVDEFARLKGLPSPKVIEMIRDGFYIGRKVGEEWYVNASESTGSASKPSSPNVTVANYINGQVTPVVVTDIQMPFWSMVFFMVKAVIAAIPAIIILTIIFREGLINR
ncbi:MAG: hypothetical protein KYX62_17630 [Pseudomonadota bacterium]|nr:hypothetical protein [Pseudomonadota bacterium]